MNFQEDLYDGFIDTRLYSCLNIQGQNAEKRHRFYDRNVIVTPSVRINRAQLYKKTPQSDPVKTKRKRTKPIQDKAYYPPSDSDSAESFQQQQKSSDNNPYTQNVPVYLYEHYNKKNKYLPKASRGVYKCKQKAEAEGGVEAYPAATTDPVAPAAPIISVPSEKELDKTEIVFVKEPHSDLDKSFPVESPCSHCFVTKESRDIPDEIVSEAKEPEAKLYQKSEHFLPSCADISRKLSEVEKQLQLLYAEQNKSECQRISGSPSLSQREKDEQNETELKTVNMNKSSSTRHRKKSCCSLGKSRTSVSRSSSRKTKNSKKSAKRRANTSKSKSECSKKCKKKKSIRKVPSKSSKSSKSSKCSQRSHRSHQTKAKKPSKTHHTSKKSTASIKYKDPCLTRSLTIQTLPPIAINPCYETNQKCTNNDGVNKITSDKPPPCTSPCICYQHRNSSKTYMHHGNGSSYDYSDNYYSGTGTGAGYAGSTTSRTGRKHSTKTKGYSGYDYYAGTTRGHKGGDGKTKRFMSKEAYCCDKDACGYGYNPVEVGYATTIVTRFSKYTVYEILRPSMKRPASMCKVTENVFVVKNKLRGY